MNESHVSEQLANPALAEVEVGQDMQPQRLPRKGTLWRWAPSMA